MKISFSNIRFEDIAPFVGLDHLRMTRGVGTFTLCRSRISTKLFKSIVEDIDVMMLQYEPPIEHETEVARSRFLSPIFNRISIIFQGACKNKPESMIPGRIASQGRIEYYFKIFGVIATVFIEVKRKIGDTGTDRLDAIAQVIAECDACDWVNTQSGFSVPIYAILCDGDVFEFYQSNSQDPKPHIFSRGIYYLDQPSDTTMRRLRLPDLADSDNTLPFMTALRPVCEVTYSCWDIAPL